MTIGEVRVPSVPGLALRHAGYEDAAVVLSFIRGLAEYEKLSHEVVATEHDIAEALAGEQRVIEVVLAYYNGEPAGFALFFYNFSTFLGRRGIYLEDLFVDPALRGSGIGTALLTYLAKIATDQNLGRLEWSVLDWNEPSIRFYQSLGALALDEWTVNRVTGEKLGTLAQRIEFREAEL